MSGRRREKKRDKRLLSSLRSGCTRSTTQPAEDPLRLRDLERNGERGRSERQKFAGAKEGTAKAKFALEESRYGRVPRRATLARSASTISGVSQGFVLESDEAGQGAVETLTSPAKAALSSNKATVRASGGSPNTRTSSVCHKRLSTDARRRRRQREIGNSVFDAEIAKRVPAQVSEQAQEVRQGRRQTEVRHDVESCTVKAARLRQQRSGA